MRKQPRNKRDAFALTPPPHSPAAPPPEQRVVKKTAAVPVTHAPSPAQRRAVKTAHTRTPSAAEIAAHRERVKYFSSRRNCDLSIAEACEPAAGCSIIDGMTMDALCIEIRSELSKWRDSPEMLGVIRREIEAALAKK